MRIVLRPDDVVCGTLPARAQNIRLAAFQQRIPLKLPELPVFGLGPVRVPKNVFANELLDLAEKPRREKPKAGKKPASGFSIFLLAIMVLLLLFLLICLVVMLMKCGIIPGADSHFVRSFAIWFNSHLFPLF